MSRKKKLIWQLYPSFLAVALIALAAALIYFSHTFRRFYYEQMRSELRMLAGVAAPQIARTLADPRPGEPNELCKHLAEAAGGQVRFTIITPAGKVRGDSHEDPALMEDHSNRPEIINALREGFGQSVRPSPTLGERMMYVALPIQSDSEPLAVVRVAVAVTAIDQVIDEMFAHILWAGVGIVACLALLSLLISRNISRPVVTMKRTAQLFAKGQFKVRVPAADVTELDDLAGALNEMAAQLRDRILTITGQRNELETILASMTEGVFAVDSGGRIVSANKAAAQLLDVDLAQIQGRAIEEIIHNVELQQFIRDALSSGKPAEGDLSFSLEGGRHFRVHAAQLVDPRGPRAGIVIVLSDMTRLRRLEDLRRDFVANVSHELKTPLTSIQGFAEALEAAGAKDPEQTRRYLSIIARHAQRLKGVLAAALEMSSVKAEEKRMKVVLSCDEDLEARINAPLLEQAILNLLDNAIKYSEPGGTIEVRALAQDSDVAISVKDDGCGIPPEHLSRIFERFYVADKGRSRKLGGTGLGLAIVKHIAQVHGGYVAVESTPGRGSTFTLHLPRV